MVDWWEQPLFLNDVVIVQASVRQMTLHNGLQRGSSIDCKERKIVDSFSAFEELEAAGAGAGKRNTPCSVLIE
jgi:hypothetical protein